MKSVDSYYSTVQQGEFSEKGKIDLCQKICPSILISYDEKKVDDISSFIVDTVKEYFCQKNNIRYVFQNNNTNPLILSLHRFYYTQNETLGIITYTQNNTTKKLCYTIEDRLRFTHQQSEGMYGQNKNCNNYDDKVYKTTAIPSNNRGYPISLGVMRGRSISGTKPYVNGTACFSDVFMHEGANSGWSEGCILTVPKIDFVNGTWVANKDESLKTNINLINFINNNKRNILLQIYQSDANNVNNAITSTNTNFKIYWEKIINDFTNKNIMIAEMDNGNFKSFK